MQPRSNWLRRLTCGGASAVLLVGLAALVPGGANAAPPSGEVVNVHASQSDGMPLAGVDINYSCDGGPTLDYGVTGVGGGVHSRLPEGKTCTFFANYRGTTATSDPVTIERTTNVFFQTSAVTVTLADHAGAPLTGGVASYKAGSTTVYLNATPALSSTDATGAVTGQMFDGTYDFRMAYNGGTQWKSKNVDGNTTVPFQTGLLSVVYSNPLSYGGPTGDSAWFTKSGMELLPGTYTFHPRGVGYPANSGCKPISIDSPAAGEVATKTIFAAQLADSSGQPLADGTATYYSGSWKPLGTTDSTGSICEVVDGSLGSIHVRMTYRGTSQMKGPQNVASDSLFSFQTLDVTVELRDHSDSLLDPGVASYYAGAWRTIGSTDGGEAHAEMLQGSYSFAMTYLGSRQQLDGQVVSDSSRTITFQTGQVVSDSGTATSYYANGWKPFTSGMQLLPGSYWFDFSDTTPNSQLDITGGTVNHIH